MVLAEQCGQCGDHLLAPTCPEPEWRVSETSESPEPGERGRDQGHRIHGMDASVGGKSGVFW